MKTRTKNIFSGKITDRIKTFEDACEELGMEPIDVDDMIAQGFTKDDIAYQKLKTIAKALNGGWVPDVCDSSIRRWYPWFYPNGSPSSFAFGDSHYVYSTAYAWSGSRLCFKSEELSNYAGRQFIDLWKEFIL